MAGETSIMSSGQPAAATSSHTMRELRDAHAAPAVGLRQVHAEEAGLAQLEPELVRLGVARRLLLEVAVPVPGRRGRRQPPGAAPVPAWDGNPRPLLLVISDDAGGALQEVDNRGMNRRPLSAIVLAAGEGTRMRSGTPKPLHRLCGRPMVLHVLDALAELTVERVAVVVGHGATEVSKTIQAEAPTDLAIEFVEQPEPRGTGDAVAVALTGLPRLLRRRLRRGRRHRAARRHAAAAAGDARVPRRRPPGERRRRHAAHRKAGPAEPATRESSATRTAGWRASSTSTTPATTERQIDEVATTVYCFRHGVLAPALRRLSPDNSLGEYYLTDTIGVLHDAGYAVTTVVVADPAEAARGERQGPARRRRGASCGRRINARWMRRGVTMWDPERTYLDASVRLAADVTLAPRCHPRGPDDGGRGGRPRALVSTSSTARSGPARG